MFMLNYINIYIDITFLIYRDMEVRSQNQSHHGTNHLQSAYGYQYLHYIVFLCLAFVLIAVLLHSGRLKRCVKPITFSNLPSQLKNMMTSSKNVSGKRNREKSKNEHAGRYPLVSA